MSQITTTFSPPLVSPVSSKAPSWTGATEQIYYQNGVLTLWDQISQTSSNPSNPDVALNNAIANLGTSGGTIKFGRGTYTFLQNHVLSNVEISSEEGAIFVPGTGFSATVPAGFTKSSIFTANGNVYIKGISVQNPNGVTGVSFVNQLAPILYIQNCPDIEMLITISAANGATFNTNSCGVYITNNLFKNGGGITFTIPSTSPTVTVLENVNIAQNTWDPSCSVACIQPDNTGTVSSCRLQSWSFNDNSVLTTKFTGLAEINFGGIDDATQAYQIYGTGGGGGNSQIRGNRINIVSGSKYCIYLSSYGSSGIPDVLENSIGINTPAGATTSKVALIRAGIGVSNGAQGIIYGRINDNYMWSQGPGGYPSLNNATHVDIESGIVNLIDIQDNYMIGGAYGIHVVFNSTLTNAYAIKIEGNRIDKVQFDCINVDVPSGGTGGEIIIANNYLQNPNWGDSGTDYAGIALGRSGGKIYGPTTILGNRISTHQSQPAYGLYVPTNVDVTAIHIANNIALAQTTTGTTNPSRLNNFLYGITPPSSSGSINISVPASGSETFNPLGVPISLLPTGGAIQAIAINGVTTGLVSGVFYLSSMDTFTITYSVAPTLTAIVHG
jgi:hypothetical protein